MILEMEDAITRLTSKRVRGPGAIRKFIAEQRARHPPSRVCSRSDEDGGLPAQPSRNDGDNGSNSHSTLAGSEDDSSNSLTKEELEPPQQTGDYDSDGCDCKNCNSDSDSDRPNRQRCFLAELERELDGYYGEFLQDGHRSDRLDYVLKELGIDDSLSVQGTEDAIVELWERLRYSDQESTNAGASSSGTSRCSGSTHDTLNSEPRRQPLRLGPTTDQLFIMAHVEMAYQEKRARAIGDELHGWTTDAVERLDDHIAALCSKLSEDQKAFLEQQWDQFYQEATDEDLEGVEFECRLHRYEELGTPPDYNLDDYSEQQRRIFADCGLCSRDDGSLCSGSHSGDSGCDALDCGAHAADSSFQCGQQQRQLQPQQRQGPLQSMVDRPPKEITMPSPVRETSCTTTAAARTVTRT